MLNWILSQFKRQRTEDLERAREMVRAAKSGRQRIDPVKARELARALGIEVDAHQSIDQVIDKIRRYLTRIGER
ncbi:hypothetical protein [Aromatoleum aromaticum]|uniref:hypothetical protein n=1 Tax=Aromatoleum aromaticum TaxID=551760 RepID=UPI0005A15E9C|nr:hypothetical protein [Aromatoleum aromaticum]NMG56884.1 hypothetical protein [Aromatoleum aromaticum]